MVRAAAGGVVDYSKADQRSGRWLIAEQMLIAALQREELLQYLKSSQTRSLLLLLAPLTPDARERHFGKAQQLWMDYHDVLLYRQVEDKKVRDQQDKEAMTAAWEREFGRLSDISTKESVDAVADWLKQRRKRKEVAKDGAELRNRLPI